MPFINDVNFGFADCSVKDFNDAAQTLDDVASLVEEVGISKLSNDLGINMAMF